MTTKKQTARKPLRHAQNAELNRHQRAAFEQVRKEFKKSDWDDFDPKDYIYSAEDLLAVLAPPS
jgi:hypothetical protein